MQNTSAVSWTVLTAHTYVFQFHEWKAGNVIISDTDGNIQMYPADFLWHNWKRVQSEWLTCLCEMQSRCHTPTIKGLEMCNSWSVALEKFEMIDLVWIKLQVLWWTPGWCVWLVFKGIICGRIKAVFVYRFSDNRVCLFLCAWVWTEFLLSQKWLTQEQGMVIPYCRMTGVWLIAVWLVTMVLLRAWGTWSQSAGWGLLWETGLFCWGSALQSEQISDDVMSIAVQWVTAIRSLHPRRTGVIFLAWEWHVYTPKSHHTTI